MRLTPYLMLLILAGCTSGPNEKPQASVDTVQIRETTIAKKVGRDTMRAGSDTFALVTSYPVIKDTAGFIKQLKKVLRTKLRYVSDRAHYDECITYYKKIVLNGSTKKYILCEYDYVDGSNAEYPWKFQVLFNENGKLVKVLDAFRFEFLKVFPGESPFLLTVLSTSRGNGGHQLFKISADTLENVYEGYTDYQTKTYDAYEDNAVFENDELKLTVKDIDADGYNDLTFSGKMLLLQGLTKDSMWYDFEVRGKDTISYTAKHPFKTIPVKYVFLYNRETKHFVESGKYSKKAPFW